jgi:small-conductance mechanosensitive channel
MRAADLPIADSFWTDHRNVITAVITVVGAFVLAQLVDHAISARGSKLANAMPGPISPVASTRLRLVRRLIYVGIIVIGIALALAQFAAVKRVATGVLASSAVLGLVVGFAARQTLANAVAGILLAITQPIRIGDLITYEDSTGSVEDIRLTYTYVRTDDGTRVVIPNERLASTTVHNHTILDAALKVEVSVWISPDADPVRALAVMRGSDELEVSVAEIDKDGVRLSAVAWARTPAERGQMAAGLRVSCLERLRNAGLSAGLSSATGS